MLKCALPRRFIMYVLVVLFVGFSILPSIGTTVAEESFFSMHHSNTLYVGGNGSNNYTKIQDAIDNASEGATIFVYNGIYKENLLIYKTIILTGEDKCNTIIDGGGNGSVVNMTTDRIILSGFTIKNSSGSNSAGIMIFSNYNNISRNIITNNPDGILTDYNNNALNDGYNVISENIIKNNGNGMDLLGCNNTISRNNISHNEYFGIVLEDAYNNNVFENTITYNEWGIYLSFTSNNVIYRNSISNNMFGIELFVSSNDRIIQNNFIGNKRSAYFDQPLNYRIEFRKIHGQPLGWIIWDENYWNRPRLFPKPIFGLLYLGIFDFGIPNWVNFDWYPAQGPYEVMGG